MISAGHKAPLAVSWWGNPRSAQKKKPCWKKSRARSLAQKSLHHRGEGFAFEPIGAPPGLRSTAPLFPPACSSMDFVLPGLARPLVCGTDWGLERGAAIDPSGWGAVMPGLSLAFCAFAAPAPIASTANVQIVANFIMVSASFFVN
jgi:hypothetical protein